MKVFKLTYLDIDDKKLWIEVEANSPEQAEKSFKRFDERCKAILKIEELAKLLGKGEASS
jgi:hypothetical protein